MAPYVVLNNPYFLCNSLPDITTRGFVHATSWRQGTRLDFLDEICKESHVGIEGNQAWNKVWLGETPFLSALHKWAIELM